MPAKSNTLSLILVLFLICFVLGLYARGPVTSGNTLAKEVPAIIEKTALGVQVVVEAHAPISAQDINLAFQIKAKLFLKSISRALFREAEVEERGEQYVLRELGTGKEILCKVRIYGDHVIGVALTQGNSTASEHLNTAFSEAFQL